MADRDIPEEGRRYTLEELTLSPAERERVELRGLLMAAIHDGLDGAVTGLVSDRGVERCADHILREWVPRVLAGRSGSVRDIPEEMVEKAAAALATFVCSDPDQWKWYTEHAELALAAALAGRTVLHSECDAIVPKAPPDDWTPSPCGAEMQWFGCCANGHDQRQTLPFDARDRIERVLRVQGVASGSVEGAAHRVMRALTEPAAGSGVGDQDE